MFSSHLSHVNKSYCQCFKTKNGAILVLLAPLKHNLKIVSCSLQKVWILNKNKIIITGGTWKYMYACYNVKEIKASRCNEINTASPVEHYTAFVWQVLQNIYKDF